MPNIVCRTLTNVRVERLSNTEHIIAEHEQNKSYFSPNITSNTEHPNIEHRKRPAMGGPWTAAGRSAADDQQLVDQLLVDQLLVDQLLVDCWFCWCHRAAGFGRSPFRHSGIPALRRSPFLIPALWETGNRRLKLRGLFPFPKHVNS